ncbi:MAG: DHHA1 domain-containing protein [Aquificota bacterium]|nr:DHHA1 domain-containing protein [Aquificota bacterium]
MGGQGRPGGEGTRWRDLSRSLQAKREEIPERVEDLKEKIKEKEREIERLRSELIKVQMEKVLKEEDLNGYRLSWGVFKDVSPEELRNLADLIRNRGDREVVFLVSETGKKVLTVIGVSRKLSERLRADELIREVGKVIGGGGGGRPDLAQGGGKNAQALEEAVKILRERLRSL